MFFSFRHTRVRALLDADISRRRRQRFLPSCPSLNAHTAIRPRDADILLLPCRRRRERRTVACSRAREL